MCTHTNKLINEFKNVIIKKKKTKRSGPYWADGKSTGHELGDRCRGQTVLGVLGHSNVMHTF